MRFNKNNYEYIFDGFNIEESWILNDEEEFFKFFSSADICLYDEDLTIHYINVEFNKKFVEKIDDKGRNAFMNFLKKCIDNDFSISEEVLDFYIKYFGLNNIDYDGNNIFAYILKIKNKNNIIDIITELIVDKNIDINYKNNFGETPLIILANLYENYKNCIEEFEYLMKLLINNGADKYLKNNNNMTAYDILEFFKKKEILNIKEKMKDLQLLII